MTSCLMPLANAAGKHIVTVEGINPADGSLTPVQQAMVDESGTQCGFCTVGFVVSLTGFCIDDTPKTPEMAVSAVDGNICRCTGYKSIERAAIRVCEKLTARSESFAKRSSLKRAIADLTIPEYFENIDSRLAAIYVPERRAKAGAVEKIESAPAFVSGGTDLYVQRPETMAETSANNLFYSDDLRGIKDNGDFIELGGSVTVTDLLESPEMHSIFPDLYKHLKLVSSTPIRNMATLAGNFVNASPIGDMTVWFLALDAEVVLATPSGGDEAAGRSRSIKLKDLYLGYKQLAKSESEYIKEIRFPKPSGDFRFNFEKVCKRTYLDIATVNTAISLTVAALPGPGWVPPALSSESAESPANKIDYTITAATVSAGGVAPLPLYLKETSAYLAGRRINAETLARANAVMQAEISPISDVRGTEKYKRQLLKQLFAAHFLELFENSI
jgi:xanthine dehydrogenase small subunit